MNKTTIISTCDLIYGAGAIKPILPLGWIFIEGKGEWLRARSPDGRLWFVSRDRLYRLLNRIPGQYIDTNQTVTLPQLQLQ